MIYKATFYNQTGRNVKWGVKTVLFSELKCNSNPIGYCDKLGLQKYHNKLWFDLAEYCPIFRKFYTFFAGMNF